MSVTTSPFLPEADAGAFSSDAPAFIPLALDEADMAAYASMGVALGCGTETCAEAFMLATPAARELAVQLWRGAVFAAKAGGAELTARMQAQWQAEQALEAMRALIGLAPERMPHAALAAAGLRYSA
ncbi:polysaccharide deacetylase [Teichococcus vastitatis]|uniref:Polysaccharide deacetylase n=1 Tax=Teichococcus vastitatis TaxID=2307076 RepID=A0ABS9W660_9PROT|nr:polysaccharide deacetylase [Pseudoroseomonas vastitatis]MCI0754771.1 polysaccharide deacetylase [Pseudoroseomonas vastitatis]